MGNNEVAKLTPNTLALLQVNHYRVYLISVLSEMLFDLFQLLLTGKIEDYRKDKLKKIYDKIGKEINEFITPEEFSKLSTFKEIYRTPEFHKFSKVRSFISKSHWNHFQEEEKIIDKIIERISLKYR